MEMFRISPGTLHAVITSYLPFTLGTLLTPAEIVRAFDLLRRAGFDASVPAGFYFTEPEPDLPLPPPNDGAGRVTSNYPPPPPSPSSYSSSSLSSSNTSDTTDASSVDGGVGNPFLPLPPPAPTLHTLIHHGNNNGNNGGPSYALERFLAETAADIPWSSVYIGTRNGH